MSGFKQFLSVAAVALAVACNDNELLPTDPEPGMAMAASVTANSTLPAAIITDKEDYVPHEPVAMIGSGWQPGETVTLTLSESPEIHDDRSFTVVADTLGNFGFEEFAPEDHHAGVQFLLTAVGESGTQAQTTFTDAIAFGAVSTNFNGSGSSPTSLSQQNLMISSPLAALGDILIAHVAIATGVSANDHVCPPAAENWQLIQKNRRDDKILQQTFYRVVTSAEVVHTIQWSFKNTVSNCGTTSGNISRGAAGGIIRYSGVDTSNPVENFAFSAGSSSSPYPAPVVNATSGSLILRFYSVFKNTTISHPSVTRRYSVGSANSPAERAVAAFEAIQGGTGTNPTPAFDATFASSAEWAAQTVVLRAAPPAGPTKLAFTSVPFEGVVNQCLGALAVRTLNASDVITNVAANTTVNLATNRTGTFYSDNLCTTSITNFLITTGNSDGTFFYKGTARGDGAHQLTASASGLTSATQTQTINKAPQTVAFTSTAPVGATVGGPTYTVTATGGGSGNAVVFSSLTTGVCTLAGSTVSLVAVGTCTIAANQAGNDDYLAADQQTQSFQVGQTTATITLGGLSHVYDGSPKSATATTNPPALPVVFTYDGSPTPPTNAGSYAVVATINDPNYTGTESGTLTIGQAPQTINFTSTAPTNAVVGGPVYTVGATGGGSGNAVVLSSLTPGVCTVSGNTVSFIAVGTCTVAANQAGNQNYLAAPQATQSFAVAKGTATIALSNLSHVFDGNPKAATATTTPAGLAVVTITYDGSTTAPTDAGNYAVVASLNNANYEATDATGTLVIDQAEQTITFTSTAPATGIIGGTYAVSATATSGLAVAFSSLTPTVCTVSSGTVSFTGIGTCNVAANQAGNTNYLAAPQVTQSILIKYIFEGFFAPVDRPNTMNVSKAGQAIPLKWRLLDAGGNPVTNLAAVTVQAVNLGCALGDTTDQLEEYASGSSGLQNLGDGYYQFNWKTPTSYASSCKSIKLVFGTGALSYIEGPLAYFSFKK